MHGIVRASRAPAIACAERMIGEGDQGLLDTSGRSPVRGSLLSAGTTGGTVPPAMSTVEGSTP
jgi:hypothetical protein